MQQELDKQALHEQLKLSSSNFHANDQQTKSGEESLNSDSEDEMHVYDSDDSDRGLSAVEVDVELIEEKLLKSEEKKEEYTTPIRPTEI